MKTVKFISALTFCTLFSIAQNGALIDFKFTSSKGTGGNMLIKHSEWGSRSDVSMKSEKAPGGGMTMSTLVKKDSPDVIYVMNDANRSYSEMKKGAPGTQEDNHTYTVKKIGNESVNGYKCIHFTVTNEKNETSDMWTSKDVGDYNKYADVFRSDKRFGSSKQDQAIKAAGCEGFPVKVKSNSKDGEGEVTMELVKFEKKSYTKSDFEIPAGYTKAGGPGAAPMGIPGMKTQEEIMKMTPDERAKYIEEMKKMYGKGK